ARVSRVKSWLWVDDGSGPCPDWATPYEAAIAAGAGSGERTVPPWGRHGDDLYMLYTGGTTGMPKGVMWRQDDLYNLFSAQIWHDPLAPDLDAVRARIPAPGPVSIPVCPLMHGTGSFTSFQQLCLGGSLVILTSRRFDVEELLDAIEREGVNLLAIVGDAFAKPMLAAVDAQPQRWHQSSLGIILSPGVMWSVPTTQ